MSNLKDAIKQLTTEETKKRYWPSKNPIDDPQDFPGEKNYEEEAEITDDVQLNRFHVKELRNSLSDRIQELSGAAFVGDTSVAAAREARFLKWLDGELEGSGTQGITRLDFQKIMKEAPSTGVSIPQMLDAALPGAKELYADNVGAYGGTENEEDSREKEARRVADPGAPENDTREETYRSVMGWNDDMEDEIRRGEQDTEDFHRSARGHGSDGSWEEEEERDVSKFDYVNIIPERNGKFTVKGYDSFPSHSVMAGQVRKNFLASFDSAEEAEAAFPMAKMSHSMMEPENTYDHLDNEEENEEDGDFVNCGRCGNTGYAMDNGKSCHCEHGKFEVEQKAKREENEEDSEKPERIKKDKFMPADRNVDTLQSAFRRANRLQSSGNKYWSVGSNKNQEENEEEHKDCHQCGNTGLDLGTNKPCDSCPEGEQFKKGPAKTFKQMFPNK